MKVLIDMNLAPRFVALLGGAGIEAVHLSTLGPMNASDRQIMAYAKEHGFVVLTHDLDYGAILAVTKAERPSVVQIRAGDLTPEALAGAVAAGLRQCEQALADGALLTIDPARLRLHVLPLNAE